MPRILMILTSHRLDCFRLAMDMLLAHGQAESFDRIVLLLNGVEGRHLAYVDHLTASRPDLPWDRIAGPRGKGPLVAGLQNQCVERYPDALYFKIDEDVFVSPGWADRLAAAWQAHAEDPGLGLVTPVVPNNGTGLFHLLHRFPDLMAEYEQRFPHPLTPDADGPAWKYPQIAEWITRQFLRFEHAERRFSAKPVPPERFARRFSINCLAYGYGHWKAMGGIPDDEEPAWCQWVVDRGGFHVLATDTLVHHYSFFVQQKWLDRTSLLEDLRAANLPATAPPRPVRWATRAARIAPQVWEKVRGA